MPMPETTPDPMPSAASRTPPVTRYPRGVPLDASLSVTHHALALAELLQAGLVEETAYTLGEVLTGYHELCADERWVQRPWEQVASALRAHLGIRKQYGSASCPETGKRLRPIVYRVPPKASLVAAGAPLPSLRRAA